MAVFFKITESLNHGVLYIHKHNDSSNMYFENRGEVGSATISDRTDSGQVWCTTQDPRGGNSTLTVYNTYTSSLLGDIGIYTAAKPAGKQGTLLGGVTFLSAPFNGEILFEHAPGSTTLYTMRLVTNTGAATNHYICYLTNTPEVGIVAIDSISSPPANVITTWNISMFPENLPLAKTQG